MKKTANAKVFYLESFLLIVTFVVVILILSQCFAAAKSSRDATDLLTTSSFLSRNAAEAAAGCKTPQELAEVLSGAAQGAWSDAEVAIAYDRQMQPDPSGQLLLHIAWTQDDGLLHYEIRVDDHTTGEEIYALQTAVYPGREALE